MKSEYNKDLKCHVSIPETSLEAINQLQTFLESDMWYAKTSEWKTESDMVNYLEHHFNICKNNIKKMVTLKRIEERFEKYFKSWKEIDDYSDYVSRIHKDFKIIMEKLKNE